MKREAFAVVHITTVHPWWDNRIYEKMVSMLPSKGWKVTYLAQFPDAEPPSVAGVRFISLRPGGGIMGRIRRNIDAFLKCARLRPQIVHFHDPEFVVFGMLLRVLGHKVIYDIHEDNLLGVRQKEHVPSLIRSAMAYGVAVIEYFAAKFLTTVLAERAYVKRFPRGITILNYIKASDLKSAEVKKSDGNLLVSRLAKGKLLYTGSISEDRGAFNYIELLKALPNHELYMIGRCDEQLEKELKRRAGEAISRLHLKVSESGMPYSEIEAVYKMKGWDWALAVFPRTEHYFEKELTKFFEYMYYRIPIVCSDFPVWRELIEESGTGIVVNESNIRDAAAKIAAEENGFCSYKHLPFGLKPEYLWDSQLDKLAKTYVSMGR